MIPMTLHTTFPFHFESTCEKEGSKEYRMNFISAALKESALCYSAHCIDFSRVIDGGAIFFSAVFCQCTS